MNERHPTESPVGSPEHRAYDEDQMFLNDPVMSGQFRDPIWDPDFLYDIESMDRDADAFDWDRRCDEDAHRYESDELHEKAMLDEMDRVIDEDFAERSPYRGMTHKEKIAYDLRFMENERAGTFSLGDILKDAIIKKGLS